MIEPAEHDILGSDESTEINHRQAVAEFKEDLYPAYRDEGVTLGEAMIIYHLVCLDNRLDTIKQLLEGRDA